MEEKQNDRPKKIVSEKHAFKKPGGGGGNPAKT